MSRHSGDELREVSKKVFYAVHIFLPRKKGAARGLLDVDGVHQKRIIAAWWPVKKLSMHDNHDSSPQSQVECVPGWQ
jgi:hypothetical protein